MFLFGGGTEHFGNEIDCGNDFTHSYDHGTDVTLMAVAGTGRTFSSWSGACSHTSGDCVVTVNDATQARPNAFGHLWGNL